MLDFKKIISSIADVGKGILGKKFSEKRDLATLVQLCDDLISYKVAAHISGISEIYKILDKEQKLIFFLTINEKFKPNLKSIDDEISVYLKDKKKSNLDNLGNTIEGNRQELIRRMNMAPDGTSVLVSMREDLIDFSKANVELKDFDQDMRHLFKSWFNPGFLSLKKLPGIQRLQFWKK